MGAWWRGWAVGWTIWGSEGEDGCDHGCVVIPPPGHAVYRFMNTFYEEWSRNSIRMVLWNTFQKLPEVWNDAEYRQIAICILLSIGTNMILDKADDNDSYEKDYEKELDIAIAILLLECYDEEGAFKFACHFTAAKRTVLSNGNKRDALKFYSKRLSCSCLTERYKDARKHVLKVGACSNCREEKERASLMTCGRCKVPMFCSRECHVAAWPNHEGYCDIYADIKHRQEEN